MARVKRPEAISARLPDRLTWSPPRGVAAVFPDGRFADFWPRNLSNQRVISPFECISGVLVTANETAKEAPGGVKMVRVPEDRDGQRIDNFLLNQLKGAPRSLIYKIVRSGQVRINGKRAKPDSRVAGGDEIRIPPVKLDADAGGAAKIPPKSMLERLAKAIVFEDDRLLALNKPSGVAAHGGSGVSFGAIEALRAMRPEQPFELVHRLDRDTSGILVVAKKRSALLELQALMRDGEDEDAPNKRYLALLVGKMPQ